MLSSATPQGISMGSVNGPQGAMGSSPTFNSRNSVSVWRPSVTSSSQMNIRPSTGMGVNPNTAVQADLGKPEHPSSGNVVQRGEKPFGNEFKNIGSHKNLTSIHPWTANPNATQYRQISRNYVRTYGGAGLGRVGGGVGGVGLLGEFGQIK